MAQSLIAAMLPSVAADEAAKNPGKGTPITWCRQGEPTTDYAVYRANGDKNGYMMALADAGRTIDVSPAFPLSEKKDDGYQVTFSTLDTVRVYPTFDKRPAPDKALETVRKVAPVSTTSGEGKNLMISM